MCKYKRLKIGNKFKKDQIINIIKVCMNFARFRKLKAHQIRAKVLNHIYFFEFDEETDKHKKLMLNKRV